VKFQTLALVKYPLDRVWQAMRDEMPLLAKHLDDIESITQTERNDSPGQVSIVNLWRAKPKLPDILAKHVDTSKLAWTDCATWDEISHTCTWRIEPQLFSSHFNSRGQTTFEPAMGGRGTRITFSGEAEITLGKSSEGVRKMLEDTLFKGVMSFAQGVIAKNFRKMADALNTHLDAQSTRSPLPSR
jgi:hypothetical protein